MTQRTLVTLVLLLALALPSGAQILRQQNQTVDLPRASPAASVSQRVGLTDIEIAYHRPAVNEREVWSALAPYGQVWRTGANENTVVSFSTDVTVQGQALAAGTYGLHTIPGEDEWTIIFSEDADAWGSFSYNEERDVLRVQVTPNDLPFQQERMLVAFDKVDNDSTTFSIFWDKVRVPVEIGIDTETIVLADLQRQLTGLSQFFWNGWNQAANYCLQQETNDDEALQWAERSIQAEERFENLSTKAQLLDKTGKSDESKELMARAIETGNAGQLHNYARGLLGQDRKEEALKVFQRNVAQNSEAWFVELGLARGYSAVGQFDNAVTNMKVALGKAPEPQKGYVQSLIDRLEKQEDIN